MKKCSFFRTASVVAAALAVASCGKTVRISGTVKDLGKGEVIVKLLDVNTYKVLDTLTSDASGRFSYRMEVEKGQPEFVYLYHNDTKIASMLLEKGDRVSVTADTLGNYEVSGSDESRRLAQVEKDFSDFSVKFADLAGKLDGLDPSTEEAAGIRKQMGRAYTDYYRSRVKYILENSHSLTSIPVLYQTIGGTLPVFGQATDAIHFKNISDSLSAVYPDSRYVRSLQAEAKRRTDLLSLSVRLENAPEMSYPDLELPDVNSTKVKLSEVDAKVILLHFWSASDAAQKMFNQDVLKPLYRDFHSRGLEIYQVALDSDKAMWARTVKDQGLEWINVCDGLGSASPAVLLYNLGKLPVSFVISGGELVDEPLSDAASLRKLLNSLL